MTVVLTSPALGKDVGDSHTGPEEAWLLAEGYASRASSIPDAWAADANGVPGAAAPSAPLTAVAATLVGGSNAVNIVTGGNLVIAVAHKRFTVALASSDTPAQAATKIDTALAGDADAAIVSSKLNIVSTATGEAAYVRIITGTGTVLANLGVTAGQKASGTDGRGLGTSNTGLTASTPAQDLTAAANREDPPEVDSATGIQDSGPLDPAMTFTTTDDDPNDPDVDFDYDPAGVNNDAPTVSSISPATGVAAGGTAIEIVGKDFTGATGATVGGVAVTSFVVVDDEKITAVTGAHAAGANLPVAVTNPTGTGTKASAFTYTA